MTHSEPQTGYDSKMVMLRAEAGDEILFETVETLAESATLPESATVTQRTNPYFGPKLLLTADNEGYQLTAPGPESQLLLWTHRDGKYHKVAEVRATFADELPSYDLCSDCGNPLDTVEHRRRAAIGECPMAE